MYLLSILCQLLLATVISAKSFHKYPYVFLLDIGNEELQKTNTEQIRLSMPGGSLAMRYPAMGDGDTITHVRVSGIDFGTDLKANIVDGGPGSKYVILVFAGNKGTPYDAVLTIQTISDDDITCDDDAGKNCSIIDDNNDSAEDTSDDLPDSKTEDEKVLDSQSAGNTNAEIRQPSKYNFSIDESEVYDDEDVQEEISKPSYEANSSSNENTDDENESKDEVLTENSQAHRHNSESKVDISENDELEQDESDIQDEDVNVRKSESSQVEPAHSDFSDDYGNEASDNAENSDDISKYTKYQPLIPKLYGGLKVYPQNAVPLDRSYDEHTVYNSKPNELDQTFNDEELHNNKRNKVANNNYFVDADDTSAVES